MKWEKVLLMVEIFLFLLFLGLGLVITKKIENGGTQHLTVFSFLSKETTFDKSKVEIIENDGYDISYVIEKDMVVGSFRKSDSMKIIGTNENFQYLSGKKVIQGAWFNTLQVENKNKVVILSQQAALQYYGSTNVLSNELTIEGITYKVVGVVKDEQNRAVIYIPAVNMEAYHGVSQGYSQLWCNLQNKAEISLFLQRLDIDATMLRVFHMGEYQRVAQLRIRFIFLLLGIVITIQLVKKIKLNAENMLVEIKSFFCKHYLNELGQLVMQRQFLKRAFKLLFYVVVIMCLYRATCFAFIIPNSTMPGVKNEYLVSLGHIIEFYMQPHVWVDNYNYMNDLNALSIVAFFFTIWMGSIVIRRLKMHYVMKDKVKG